MDHLYNYVPGQTTPAATPGHICAPAGPHDGSALLLAPCACPEHGRRDRRDLSFIDSTGTAPRNPSACFLQSVWCPEGRPQDTVTGPGAPGGITGTPVSGSGACAPAGKSDDVHCGGAGAAPGVGGGGGGAEHDEASAGTLPSFPLVHVEHFRGSCGAGGLTTTESLTSTDIVGISNMDAARLTHPYAPNDRPFTPADVGRGELPRSPAKREVGTPPWAVTQVAWSAASTRRGSQTSNQPPSVEVPADVRYAHPGYFARPSTAAERWVEEAPATPLPTPLARGAQFWHPVYAGEIEVGERTGSARFSIRSDPSTGSSPVISRHGSAHPRTMLAPTRAPPPAQQSSAIVAVVGDRRVYDLHHRLAEPPKAEVVATRDVPPPATERPLPPLPPSPPPRPGSGWAVSAGAAAGAGVGTARRSPGGGPSLAKTRTPAMAGGAARGPAQCGSASALSWPDESVYDAQRLDCQSPRELVDATFLVAVLLLHGATAGDGALTGAAPSQSATSAVLTKVRQMSARAETLAPPTTTASSAATAAVAPAPVAVQQKPASATVTAAAQASVALCSPGGTCIPVLPMQLPAALQPVPYASDPHQANAAHTLLEAIHRPSQSRGRRSPAAAATGNIFVPAVLLASSDSATAGTSGGSGHATPYMSLVPTPPPRPSGTPLLRAAGAGISSPGAATHPPLTTHQHPHAHHHSAQPPAAVTAAAAVRSSRRPPPRVPTSSGTSLDASHPSWSARKTMMHTTAAMVATTATTMTSSAPTVAVRPVDGADFVQSVVSNAGLSGSNLTTVNRPLGGACEPARPTSALFNALPSRPSFVRPYRPGESAAEVPSMLSLIDIGIAADAPSPHKSSVTPPPSAPPPHFLPVTASSQPSRSTRTGNATRRSPPPSLAHPVSFADSAAMSVRERAISHMECGAQPEPGEAEDSSFYKASLLDVANRMAAAGPLSPLSDAATAGFAA